MEANEQFNEAVDSLHVHEAHLEAEKVGPEDIRQVLGIHFVLS